MKKFYIITNTDKDVDNKVTKKVESILHNLGSETIRGIAIHGEYQVPNDIECIITLGGDGTLINAARILYECKIPIIGINLGHLGFLTEIELGALEEGLNQLVNGAHIFEERMMLEGKINEQKYAALNDIVLTRNGAPKVINFDIYINGKFLHSYKADGIIISTPTGSTAYNMSAGGPIVDPTAAIFVVTPICSHSLYGRSIVLNAQDTIEVKLNKEAQKACVSFDGSGIIDMNTSGTLVINRGEHTVRLLKLNAGSFLETLRRKMEG